jgi:hypothetical protein
MEFKHNKMYTARVKLKKDYRDDGGIETIDLYRNKTFEFIYKFGDDDFEDGFYIVNSPAFDIDNIEDSFKYEWGWNKDQLDFLNKKERKGFSIELYTKETIEDYVVYFEEKHDKVVYCYIQDSFIDTTFRAKAICHKDDIYSRQDGMVIAFERCVEKRINHYNKLMNSLVDQVSIARDHTKQIEYKFSKFIKK